MVNLDVPMNIQFAETRWLGEVDVRQTNPVQLTSTSPKPEGSVNSKFTVAGQVGERRVLQNTTVLVNSMLAKPLCSGEN